MAKTSRLTRSSRLIDLSFVERERTPTQIIEVWIRLHLAGVSLSNTVSELEKVGVDRSRTAVHNWVQKADLEPTGAVTPTRIAMDETVIRVNGRRCWLYAAIDPPTNQFLHVRLFPTLTTQLTVELLRELRAKCRVDDVTFLVDGARHLQVALDRLGLDFWVERHGQRNRIERVFREITRRTSSFANEFRNAALATAESWLQAFVVWHDARQS